MLAMALAIPLCVLVVGVIVVIVMVLRRQLARVHQKNLQLTAKITGVVECEVKLLTYCFFRNFEDILARIAARRAQLDLVQFI